MISRESRLDYVVHVPDGVRAQSRWPAQLRVPAAADEQRPAGYTPDLTLDDFDVRPGVCRTRLTLNASDEATAQFREVSFTVDRDFAGMLRPRDEVHIAQNWNGGLGVSILRSGVLVAAAGAVSAVPLGDTVVVDYPGDLATQAEDLYRARDPKYRRWEVPVQIETAGSVRLVYRARIELGRHEFFVVRGFVLGTECVAISLLGVCPDCAATLTAPLLEKPGIQARPFHDPKERREMKVLFALESARFAMEKGDLDAAMQSVIEAIVWDRESEEAQQLFEEIERRRYR